MAGLFFILRHGSGARRSIVPQYNSESMNQLNFLSQTGDSRRYSKLAVRWAGALALLGSCISGVLAENTNSMVKPPVAIPGGLSPYPVITSVTKTQELVTVQWFGIQGPFELLHSMGANTNSWEQIGSPTFGSQLTVRSPGDLGFFRVLSGRPVSTAQTGGTMNYVGASVCADCHQDTHQEWNATGHARALESLKAVNQQNNAACLVCHTVGYGTPLGFKDEATTPQLAGVQCENCHGPAGNHISNVRDTSVRPKVTLSAEVCGGCHNYHHPTFDEWKLSLHATPNPDVSAAILQQGESRMLSCGPCHSGAVRESLLEGLEHPGTSLPSREDAAYFPVTCGVCHDAHANMDQPPKLPNPQLRNPVYSTDNFSYNTSANTTFAAQYNPDIQVCGQCHNMRGATWQDTSRSPHHSPQYNILIGQGAYDLGQPSIGPHGADIPNQCVRCHSTSLPTGTANSLSPTNFTGHTFQLAFDGCAVCHITERAAQNAMTNTQQQIKLQIGTVQGLLNQWATTKAPADLQAKYGALTWEYTLPGELSNPTNNPSILGPTAAEQARVPNAIKQARMNVYLVQLDGSFGVHNADYSRHLLNVAKTNINLELAKP
jgi:Cytochrome c554 and c-prime